MVMLGTLTQKEPPRKGGSFSSLLSNSSVVVLVSLVVVSKAIGFTEPVQHRAQQIHSLLSQRCGAVPSSSEPRAQIKPRIRGSRRLRLRRDGSSIPLHHPSMCDTSTCTP